MSEITPFFPGYDIFLRNLKERILITQCKAAVAVNKDLVMLYWSIGSDISSQIQTKGWGMKVVDRISTDLMRVFPNMKGFSPRNLWYMRSFTDAWSDDSILQQVVAKLRWGHNCIILDKLTRNEERLQHIF